MIAPLEKGSDSGSSEGTTVTTDSGHGHSDSGGGVGHGTPSRYNVPSASMHYYETGKTGSVLVGLSR